MRPVNLVIIGLTMWIFHEFFISSGLVTNYSHNLHAAGLLVLVFSTLIIAGAGNMINDYFDIRIDRINKPADVIVGKYVKRREVILLHVIFNTLAVGAGIWLWIKFDTWIPAATHVLTTSLLWLYSVVLKKKFLIGNITIALLTALVPLIIFWYEITTANGWIISWWNKGGFLVMKKVVYVFAGFAFITTLIREIQKDFADETGDKMFGCKTVPVIMGSSGRWLVVALIVFTLAVLGVILFLKPFLLEGLSAWTLPAIVLPLILSLYVSVRANNRKAWLLAGNLMKLTMLGGILYLGVFVYAVENI